MTTWVKFEKRKVTQLLDGMVYRTKHVGFEWFPVGQVPSTSTIDLEGCMWYYTSEFPRTQVDKPME